MILTEGMKLKNSTSKQQYYKNPKVKKKSSNIKKGFF